MMQVAPFTQRAVSLADYGQLDDHSASLVARFIQLDLVSCLMILQLEDKDHSDAHRVLSVYAEGRCFGSWAEGTEQMLVF